MKVMRKIIEIDEERCDGCGLCVPACAEGSLEIIEGKARVISDNLCDGLGACLGECPNDALRIVEREAEEFDEAAVEKFLTEKEIKNKAAKPLVASGCPSSRIQRFAQPSAQGSVFGADPQGLAGRSALGHWPIQIHLVPPTAPFLKNADLLVLADCVPVAFPTLHRDFLQGKAVMMGCPKLDDTESYIQKFTQIFRTAGVRSITAVVMEVPCCSGLPMIVKKSLDAAGVEIPMKEVVVSTRGEILSRSN
ncbi:MAG: 4Fe-4S ferredoxin [Deltaproteobacteria bacterium SG8_13]|nr:MAG: 4Fe-4S ferredoxin [Deltaproteobacteria bacterium SG8_13]